MLWLVAAFVFVVVTLDGPPLPEAGPARSRPASMNALECARRVRARLDRAAQRRQEVGEHLDAADPDVLRLHPLRQRHRPDSDVRSARRCSITSCCTPAEDSFVKQVMHGGTTATAQLQRHRGAGDDHVRRDHRRRHARRTASCKHWMNIVPHGLHLADLHHPDSDRDDGHVRPAVRAHDATCGEHDRRPHRDSRDSVVRVPLHGDCSAAASPASASASWCRCRWRSASRRSRSSSCWCRRTSSRC